LDLRWLKDLRPLTKTAIVLFGYGSAIAVACLLTYLQSPPPNDPRAYSQGMTAESDSIVFFESWAFLSLAPTVLVFWFLRSWARFWQWSSWLGLAMAATAPLAEAMNIFLVLFKLLDGWWSLLSFLGLVRLFAIPFMTVGFALATWMSPDKKARWRFLVAGSLEVLTGLFVALSLIFRSRLF
jgi:hypothetical protein